MDRHTEQDDVFIEDDQFTVTWKRWLVLAIASLLNMSIAMIWLCFSPVAYKTASYYDTDLILINTLSLVFMITAIPCGLLCLWVMEKYGLRICLLICAWCGCIGSLVRICSTITSLSRSEKLFFLFLGQIIASLGSPFGLYTPPKLAAAWFPDNQRTIANTIAASANPVGIILTGLVSPLFLHSDGSYDMRLMLAVYTLPIMVGAVLTTLFITSNGPCHPPSYGGIDTTTIKVAEGVKRDLRNPMFMLLVICLGGGIALYSAFATLLEQVLCPWGYTDAIAGICASVLTSSGIVGALIIGLIVDKTKRFSESLKAVYCLTAAGVILLSLTHDIYMGYAIIAEVALIGFFAFTIYPVGTEIAAECTYPVGVATSTGFIQLSGQLQSIIMILLLSSIGSPMTEQQVINNNSQCHISTDPVASGEEEEVTYDMRVPTYVAAGLCTSLALVLTFVFRAKYRRMDAERQHTTELFIRRQSALPHGIHLSTKQNDNSYENSDNASVASMEKKAPSVSGETYNEATTTL